MNCETARDLLLTADPAELAGQTESELTGHLRSCAACRRAAALLVDAVRELETELRPLANGAAARRAIVAAARRHTRARLAGRLVPLAAAAGLASLLLVRRGPSIPPAIRSVPTAAIHDVSATAPPGRSVAVLRTDDPNIVVIWFF